MPKLDEFSHVVDYIAQLSTDKKQLRRALDGLLSTNEQQELCQRLRIFELLSQGLPQRDVAKRLGVGIATVSRGSKALQAGDYFAITTPHQPSSDS